MIARHIVYSGHVQGVGFRYTTRQIAAGYDICGYVRNCSDGRVELLVEGTAKELGGFLDAVDAELGGFIRNRQDNTSEASGAFSDFTILH